jgi:hypothetical protein
MLLLPSMGPFSIPQRGKGTQERIIGSPRPNAGEGAGGEGGLHKLSHSASYKEFTRRNYHKPYCVCIRYCDYFGFKVIFVERRFQSRHDVCLGGEY